MRGSKSTGHLGRRRTIQTSGGVHWVVEVLSDNSASTAPPLMLRQLFGTREATSSRLFEICVIALSAADEMKSYNCCQEHINASAVQGVL